MSIRTASPISPPVAVDAAAATAAAPIAAAAPADSNEGGLTPLTPPCTPCCAPAAATAPFVDAPGPARFAADALKAFQAACTAFWGRGPALPVAAAALPGAPACQSPELRDDELLALLRPADARA